MRAYVLRLIVLLATVAAPACGSSGAATPEAAPTAAVGSPALTSAPAADTPVPSVAGAAAPSNVSDTAFTVAVIVDTLSGPVSRDQAQAVMLEASKLLRQLTPIGLEMIDYVEDGAGGSTNDMVSRYITSHAAALPNGIVVFSFGDGGQAKSQGGYSYGMGAPGGFQNTFVSPVMGANQIYVAVVDYSYKYAACGYGGSDAVRSSASLDGECRNQPGTPCVQQNGYSMCADAVGHLYMSTPTYFVSSMIIHQLLHPFAPAGDLDHYDTPECNTRMGYPPAFHDLQESQYHNDLCPYVYDEFTNSHRP